MRKTLKFSRKVFEGITARVLASILIVMVFAHILTMYGKYTLAGGNELKVFIDQETGVHYIGSSLLGPTMVRMDAAGNVVTEKEY